MAFESVYGAWDGVGPKRPRSLNALILNGGGDGMPNLLKTGRAMILLAMPAGKDAITATLR